MGDDVADGDPEDVDDTVAVSVTVLVTELEAELDADTLYDGVVL
jgi:hypothetical protein